MDEAINFLNIEIGVFLRYLRCFSQIESVQINKKTIELMQEAIINMRKLSQQAQIIENSTQSNDVDFLFDLNEHQYELQRHILCHPCCELFPLSKNDFTAHLHAKHHGITLNGSNSFSFDSSIENESTISPPNSSSPTTSPDLSSHHSSIEQSSADDSGYSHNNNNNNDNNRTEVAVVKTQPKYSDILKTAAPEPKVQKASNEQTSKNGVTSTIPAMSMTLGDLIRTTQCYDAISKKTTELLAPNFQRRKFESNILDLMTQCVKAFDPNLNVLPFGSAAYGLCGADSNYNILIDTRKSPKSPAMLLRSFYQYFLASCTHSDFEMPTKINENRVQKSQLRFIHKPSRIECFLRFDNDVSVVKAAKIICDVIIFKPISRQLIGYIKSWQIVVKTLAAQRDSKTFDFNTYMIAVLVIFFLQMNYGLPAVGATLMANEEKTTETTTAKSSADKTKDLNKMLADFFHFYGGRYEINNHLISTWIGRWQEQRIQDQQKHFTPEQKRLRDGITAHPRNWQQCTMFVQDLVEASLNITAEVSKEEAYKFQEMCQMFSTVRKSSPVKRIPKPLSSPPGLNAQPVRKAFSHNSLNNMKLSENHVVHTNENDKPKASVAASAAENTLNSMKKVATGKKVVAKVSVVLENAIKDGSIFNEINMELEKITHSDERHRHETRILGILKQHFKIFDRAVVLIPFGSAVFGFAGCKSNFNIFIDTRKSKFSRSSSVLEAFEKYLASTNIHLHFDGIAEIPATRTLKQQLRLTHKESGIHVLLLVDDIAVTEVPKIIQNFIAIKPICRNLIEYILAWQNAVNGILNESFAFRFNTYTIAILVIFFMQVNYEMPLRSELADAKKKPGASLKKDIKNIDKMLADFFYFYSNRYQVWNHVISVNIGRWQERRIQDQQKHFLPDQKRLRDGINGNQANWKNCTMYIEDVLRSGVNVAAEIPTKDAYGFQEVCQIFAKKQICQKICHVDDN